MTTTIAGSAMRRMDRNARIVAAQMNGLSNTDTLLQPASQGNCANWVLGHLVNNRAELLKALGEESAWSEEESTLYSRESSAITGPESAHIPMEQLLEKFAALGKAIFARLESITDEELEKPVTEKHVLADTVDFIAWHETYHTGQLEYLRQLTGINDKVI